MEDLQNQILALYQTASFEDLLALTIMTLFSVSFVVLGALFLKKKKRERLDALTIEVEKVQKEILDAKKEAPKPELVKPEAVKPEPVTPEAPKPKAPQPVALKTALGKTRNGFGQKILSLFAGKDEATQEVLEALEEVLFRADIGVGVAQSLFGRMEKALKGAKGDLVACAKAELKSASLEILGSYEKRESTHGEGPKVILFVGVNGVGKTTSIGKIAQKYLDEGQKPILGAGDTFRAAAVEQLAIWGERAGVEVVAGKENADPASVLFDAVTKAKAQNVDVVLCDTAGRLHTKDHLMEELSKVCRVLGKATPGAPHEVWLVLDATTGQNGLIQAKEFQKAANLSGLIITKLDGTAKGGMALSVVNDLKVPIKYIGVGEKVEDLREFRPQEFVDALFED